MPGTDHTTCLAPTLAPTTLDDDPGVRVFLGNRQALLFQERYVLLDSPFCFVQAVLHGMADSCEPFQIRGVKSEKGRVLGRLDNERVLEIYHDCSSLHFPLTSPRPRRRRSPCWWPAPGCRRP